MTPAEQKEYEQTRLRVAYNNSWPRAHWNSPLQEALIAKMKAAGVDQVFSPLRLDESSACDILFEDANLNRLLSTLLDLYDELPLRPDLAFDIAWRALEIAIVFYFKNFDRATYDDNSKTTEERIKRITDSVFEPQMESCPSLKQIFMRLVNERVSDSVLRYIVARMFFSGELQVKTQVRQVSTRCREILGGGLYDSYRKQYVKDEKLTDSDHWNAARLLVRILRGEKNRISEHDYDALSLQKRVTFVISGILYSSRCERFHGDFFSPLKSDRSTLKTYYGQYWLLIVSYMFFWMIVHKYLERKGVEPFFKLDDLATCINKSLDTAYSVMC